MMCEFLQGLGWDSGNRRDVRNACKALILETLAALREVKQ